MQSSRSPSTSPSRYVVGIDLGTTNSAVGYVDTHESPWRVRTLAVPQLVAPGQVESRETLPSFLYQPAQGELARGSLRLPWSQQEPAEAVGFFARDHGAMVPGRLIASAKSWLCHSGVDRTAALLPWHGAPDVDRLSPVEASSRYLRHMADAWDARFAQHCLAQQDVVLTLPASFDEVARELTVKAAAMAGLPRVVLIEEPQAAFYAWLYAHGDDWERRVEPGQKILVCDIGGGTTDFTLIRVRRATDGKVQFHRVAVGDHLILGGDNLDLALAHHIEARLGEETGTGSARPGERPGDSSTSAAPVPVSSAMRGAQLDPRSFAVLVRICRLAKESLLGPEAPDRYTVNLPGAGSRLIGGGQQVELSAEEVRRVLVDGFFPLVGLEDRPNRRQSGFQEFGLPYAPDPAVTRWLAAFLTAHRNVALDEADSPADHDPARPDIVLLNGGVFASPILRDRVLDALRQWFGQGGPRWEPLLLENERLDLAVAHGAAYYGMVRRGAGVRITAGLARSYYIGVQRAAEQATAAVCLVPAGVEPGHDVDLTGRTFDLLVSEPVEFPLFVSSTRLTDRPGELLGVDREQMTPLPPMRTVLRTRKKADSGSVAVQLHARLTEIGTLDLWCSELSGRRSWRLQFDVRSATQTDVAAHESGAEAEGVVDEAIWQPCLMLIQGTFGPEGAAKPAALVKGLAEIIGASRESWPASLLRRMWEALMDLEAGRRRSQVHEARWLNLLGFSLRPGYGMAVDDWRVAQTWNAVQGKIAHPGPMTRGEGWILWRRIGGGLAAGQHQAVAEPLLGAVRALHRQRTGAKRRGGEFTFSTHETAEVWRLLGSLELLGVELKIELGTILIDLLPNRKMEPVRPAMVWALGRLGSRQPVYGPLNTVVPVEAAGEWLRKLMDLAGDPAVDLAVMQLSRRTDDRHRDLSEKLRAKATDWLTTRGAPAHFLQLVAQGGLLDTEEQGLVFGESLPKGLRLA